MTKEQQEAIRGRCDETATGRMTLPLALRIRNECYALLDALEEAESERDEAERAFQAELGLRQKTEANRNQWKLLAEQNFKTAELTLAESERWEKRAQALEETEKENASWNNTDCNTCPISDWSACEEICESKASLIDWLSTTATDRDRWKARAIRAESDYEKARNHATNLTRRVKALERALEVEKTCMTCEYVDCDTGDEPCCRCDRGQGVHDCWILDEARFSGGEENKNAEI